MVAHDSDDESGDQQQKRGACRADVLDHLENGERGGNARPTMTTAAAATRALLVPLSPTIAVAMPNAVAAPPIPARAMDR